ncbi:hypothetical protein HJG60_009183 [Phyllostomus discolor]|uniref:Uncharacterized protein n=1 Tax=Phyllostomus discolor TaxID=89673 RepID=A0A833YS42_9CHIR|nr:hypothetical protein HJG60_009183 [Phyllostomus discolor]
MPSSPASSLALWEGGTLAPRRLYPCQPETPSATASRGQRNSQVQPENKGPSGPAWAPWAAHHVQVPGGVSPAGVARGSGVPRGSEHLGDEVISPHFKETWEKGCRLESLGIQSSHEKEFDKDRLCSEAPYSVAGKLSALGAYAAKTTVLALRGWACGACGACAACAG